MEIDETMGYLARISAFDRYQASQGIEHAAEFVAETARAIGLSDVRIERFPANGRTSWWTFQSPTSWTPTIARLTVFSDHRRLLEIDHERQPFSIATHSALPTGNAAHAPLVVWSDDDSPDIAGAIIVAGRSAFQREDFVAWLTAAGAIGFVTDATARGRWPEDEHAGRVELPPDTSLFGFSVTPRQFEEIHAAALRGAHAHVELAVDRAATMPVVTASLIGRDADREVWLTAHLCHPRPGANDNASGVAALLGAAAACVKVQHSERPLDRTVRFVWGPEFVGATAFLHQRLDLDPATALPTAVINLDMVGEDQARCGGPFVIERNPDCLPSQLGPLAEFVVREIFAATASGGGTWHASPFLGFSDHALFADPRTACPAVMLCHHHDRFNHSAGDSIDKVSPLEMLRATAAAAALATITATDNALDARAMEELLHRWCHDEEVAARTQDDSDWCRRRLAYVRARNSALLALAKGQPAPSPPLRADDGVVLAGNWTGPFNPRAMIADLSPQSQARISSLIRRDKLNYAHLLNFAIRVDGRRTRERIIDDASFALGRPIDSSDAGWLIDALLESGWVSERRGTDEPKTPSGTGPTG